jgi:dTMP kinase
MIDNHINTNTIDQNTMTKRGLIILFEGVDRVGKSTQAELLGKHISNQTNNKSKTLRFPDRTTPIGQIINQYLQNATNMDDRALHLLFAANRWEAKDSILQTLNQGIHIIVDRYSYSGVAYSAAKGIEVNWCYASEKGLPKPDLIFYLSMNSDDATKRGDFGCERYEKLEFQKKIKSIYEDTLITDEWKFIYANKSIDEISTEISTIFDNEYISLQSKPISYI